MLDRDLIDHLRKYWLLDLIVECGSFREASLRAKVTQSALSQTVSQLEGLTGKVLLLRGRGQVTATEHGRALLAKIRPVLAAIQQVQSAATPEPPPMSWLSLGAFESFARDLVPPLALRLKKRIPDMKLTLRVGRSGALTSMVRKGDLCMAVVRDNDAIGRLTRLPLTTDRLAFYAAPEHPVVAGGWDDLPNHDYGTLSPGSEGHPRYYRKLIDAASLKRAPSFVSDSFEALREAALAGAYVVVLPERMARRASGLVEIVPETPTAATPGKRPGEHEILLVSRANCDPRENDYLAAELRDLLAQHDAEALPGVTCLRRVPL